MTAGAALLTFVICYAHTICEQHALPAPSLMACVTGAQAEIARAYPPREGQTVEEIRCEL